MNDRKEMIIEAARKSFSLFGYKATTMDQISKIANVAKGTIYIYFTNKEELLKEIVRSLVDEMKKVANDTIDPKKTLFENLHAVIYKVLMFRNEHALLLKLSQEVSEMGTTVAKEVIEEIEDEVIAFISELLEQGIQQEKIKNCNPQITAFVIYKLYVTLVIDWGEKHEPLSNEEISRLFQLYLVKGLLY